MSKIMALDLASQTGWAVLPGLDIDEMISGSSKIAQPGASIGEFGVAAELWLNDMLSVHSPRYVAFEAPLPPLTSGNLNPARKLMLIAGLVEMLCHQQRIVCREAHVATVKKHWAGIGNAKKEDMIAACRRHGWRPRDDNEADAIGLLSLAVSQEMKKTYRQFDQRRVKYMAKQNYG